MTDWQNGRLYESGVNLTDISIIFINCTFSFRSPWHFMNGFAGRVTHFFLFQLDEFAFGFRKLFIAFIPSAFNIA